MWHLGSALFSDQANVASWVSVVFRSGECGILGVRGLFSDQAIVAVLGVWSEPAN